MRPQRIRRRRNYCVVVMVSALGLFARKSYGQDLPPPESVEAPPAKISYMAVDASTVVSSLGEGSIDVNGTFAPFGDINKSGLRLRVTGSRSWYKFLTGENPRTFGTGHTTEGDLLAGYQMSWERLNLVGLVGGAVAESQDQGISRTLTGVKAVISAYATPTDLTMAYGSISYSTIGNFVQLQSKVGIRLGGDFYVGPEGYASWREEVPGLKNISTMRLGAHLSSVKVGIFQTGISLGWAHNRDAGSGYYGGLNLYSTF